MEWTCITYTIADYGITFAIVLISIIGVFATFFNSKKGQEFVIERVIGINPVKAHDDDDQDLNQPNVNQSPLNTDENTLESKQVLAQMKQKSIYYIGTFCCLLGGMILSITGELIFQGCFLASTGVAPDEDCPEFSADCFIFGPSVITPISNNVSFVCQGSQKAEFSNYNISDASAWCYSWLLRFQSTKSILDQLGVAIALIGFFTTMLAAIVYLGKCKKTIILSLLLILSSGGMIIILLVFKWSFAPLTYAILALGVALGIFGLVLFRILPKTVKPKDKKSTLPIKFNQWNIKKERVSPCSKDVPMTTKPTSSPKACYSPNAAIRLEGGEGVRSYCGM